MRIILGSSSPRRKELLEKIVHAFEIMTPDIDEIPFPGEEPESFCLRASREKADALRTKAGSGEYLLISADTIVTIDGLILGKPKDRLDAESMLSRLQGRTHQVKTAVTIILSQSGATQEFSEVDTTSVTFKPLTDSCIARYLDSIHYLDKAGSYAAQENGGMIIASTEGSMTNVIGFPTGLFLRMIGKAGLSPSGL